MFNPWGVESTCCPGVSLQRKTNALPENNELLERKHVNHIIDKNIYETFLSATILLASFVMRRL